MLLCSFRAPSLGLNGPASGGPVKASAKRIEFEFQTRSLLPPAHQLARMQWCELTKDWHSPRRLSTSLWMNLQRSRKTAFEPFEFALFYALLSDSQPKNT